MVETSAGVVAGTTAVMNSPGVSLWGLFTGAELPVQIIMAILLLASFWSWAIIFFKFLEFKSLALKTRAFESQFRQADSISGLQACCQFYLKNPMAQLCLSAIKEFQRFEGGRGDIQQMIQRMDRSMTTSLRSTVDHLQSYLSFLAVVGSSSAFVGLFGTVWGIMYSFQAIAMSKNTSLAVVAPGIAEALLATALGLAAAIPAIMAYNRFVSQVQSYTTKLENFSDELALMLERHMWEK